MTAAESGWGLWRLSKCAASATLPLKLDKVGDWIVISESLYLSVARTTRPRKLTQRLQQKVGKGEGARGSDAVEEARAMGLEARVSPREAREMRGDCNALP